MQRRAFPVVFLLAVGLLLSSGVHAAAQEATPPALLPVTPDPTECTVEPRTIDELLVQVGATPVAGTPAPFVLATPAPFTLPEGEPADEATVAEITATLREVVACLNTGSFLVFFEFISDDLFQEFTAELITEEEVAFLREGPPPLEPEQYVTLVDVRAVTVLPDGRVGALVATIFPEETAEVQVDFFYFVDEDGRWLIDEIVEDLEGQYPVELATPPA